MSEQSNCAVCSEEATLTNPYQGGSYKLNCIRCGSYEIGDIAADEISTWKQRQRTNLSGWIREHQGIRILPPALKGLSILTSPTVGERAVKLLEQFAVESKKLGGVIDITKDSVLGVPERAISKVSKKYLFSMSPEAGWTGIVHPQFLAWSWSCDFDELAYLIRDFLVSETGVVMLKLEGDLCITPKGWAQLEARRQSSPTSQIGFIAMWFNDSVNNAWKAIDEGIRNAGYEPLRIDQKQHNNKIDDEIVASIRRSKFLVGDFTGQRGGVYFETGLAMGLGLPVIWLCRNDDLKDTHFDTRQYNFIVWDAEELIDLSKNLQNRIEATIGRGPLAQPFAT